MIRGRVRISIQPTIRRLFWQWRGAIITVPTVTAAVLGLRSLGLLQQLELFALDQFFLLRPREPVDERIVIVQIDEADVQAQKRWPLTDATLAQVLTTIQQQQPVAIGLDLYRDLPVEPGQAQLEQLFQTMPNLIGVQKVVASSDSASVQPPPALKALKQVGANDLILDGDGRIRRGLLALDDEQSGETMPSFAAYLAGIYLERRGLEYDFSEHEVRIIDSQTGKVKAMLPAFEPNSGSYIRAGEGGFQILMNYRGRIQQFKTVTLTEVLEQRFAPELMRDRIVIIGSTAESLKDLFFDPYSSNLTAPSRTAGVVIHANLVSEILSAALDQRPVLRTWNEPTESAWIFFCTLLGAITSWQQRHLKRPWNLIGLVGVLMLAGGIGIIGYGAFLIGWWIPVVPPILGLLGAALAITGYVARSVADMRRTFGRYLTDEVVSSLLETPSGLQLGGERRKVTVLISDLRGFSAISERLPPEQVVSILNLYLGAMSDVITRYQGTINEFIGDGIFVMFGAPIQREDDAERAIACAIAMQAEMEQVNQQNKQHGFPRLEMGIGINTGEMIVGNIGSQKRAKYTVIGNHANLAARIETYSVGRQILISEHTLKAAGQALVKVDAQMRVEPKGIREPLALYEVVGIYGQYAIDLPEEKETFLNLSEAVPVKYTVLEGKHVVGTVFEGSLVCVSESGAELRYDIPLMPLSNLKLNLLIPSANSKDSDFYAKVLNRPAINSGCVRIRFTSAPQELLDAIHNWRTSPHQNS